MELRINIPDEQYTLLQQAIKQGKTALIGKIIFNATRTVDTSNRVSSHNANMEEQSCNNCLHIRKFMCSKYKTCHNKSEWKPKKVEICPECGAEYAVGEYDDGFLCANCGADMRSNPNRIHDCYNCEWEEDRDSGECYECVKGIQDHFTPKKAEGK